MLHYKIFGKGKHTLIILHGLFGSGDNWTTLAKKFAEDFQVIVVDLRNHGHSPHISGMSYTDMAFDVVSLMGHLNVDSAYVIGHSMGGKVAMNMAIQFPSRVSKLLVADIGPKFYPIQHQPIIDALLSVDFEFVKSRTEVEEMLTDAIPDLGTRQFLLKGLYWQESEKLGWRFNLKEIAQHIDEVGKALKKDSTYTGETLFLRGANSDYILNSDLQAIRLHFPKANLQTISNSGHWLHAENPEEFYEKSMGFLKEWTLL